MKNTSVAKIIIIPESTINFFALTYFCKTQIGISKISEITFATAKKTQTKNTDFKISQKKNTTVKWKRIETNQISAQIISKFFNFTSFESECTQTKLTIFSFLFIKFFKLK